MAKRFTLYFVLAWMLALLAACDTGGGGGATAVPSVPSNAIQISIIYAPEAKDYMVKIIQEFNDAYARGINPVTGAAMASGERPIYITGKDGSSGTVMQSIVNAFIAPNNTNVEKPTIFQPSVSHWLALANHLS